MSNGRTYRAKLRDGTETDLPGCILCDDVAVARFLLDQGCIARRVANDEQDLCIQHIITATPINNMELMWEYVPGILDRF